MPTEQPPALGRRQVFVYYRVAEAQRDAAVAAARALQQRLCDAHAGLQPALLVRPEARDGQCTLMETYAMAAAVSPDGMTAALQAEIERQALPALVAWLAGPRHTEVFDACA